VFGLAAMAEADDQEARAAPRAPRDDLNSWTLRRHERAAAEMSVARSPV
jgi:hypothetical protein